MEFILNSARDTVSFAENFAKELGCGSVLAFTGDLGAGKTCFTHGLCNGIGYQGEVTSPTFAIVNVYEGGRLPLYHFDMYRVCGWEDLETTGYFDYLDRADGITVIEWSENIENALPDNTVYINIEKLGDEKRRITVSGGEQ